MGGGNTVLRHLGSHDQWIRGDQSGGVGMMVEKENVKDHSLPDYYGVIYIAYVDVGGLRGTVRVDHKETWWRIRSGVAHGDVGPARFELAIATAPGWYPSPC